MSKALCLVAGSPYSEKLSTLRLEEKDDPYASSNRKVIICPVGQTASIQYYCSLRIRPGLQSFLLTAAVQRILFSSSNIGNLKFCFSYN